MTKVWCTVPWALISLQISFSTAICVCMQTTTCMQRVYRLQNCNRPFRAYRCVRLVTRRDSNCLSKKFMASCTLWLRLNASFMLGLMDFPLACIIPSDSHCTYTSLTINKHLWRSVEMDVSHTCWYRAVPWQSVQQIAVPLYQWILVGQKWEKNYTQIPITQLQNFSFSFGFIMDSISFRSVFSDFMFILCIFFHIPHTHQLYRWGRQPAQKKLQPTQAMQLKRIEF